MPITWKKSPRFKPAVVLDRIASVRTVNPKGGAPFSAFELEHCLPALYSMLIFPDAAKEIDTNRLVWEALMRAGGDLTPSSFLTAINDELSAKLATKEQVYYLLTSLSFDYRDIPRSISVAGAEIRFTSSTFPARFTKPRAQLLRTHKVPVPPEPQSYTRVIARVKAKTEQVGVTRALRALDLQRALWCLMGNPQMQLAYGKAALQPINVVRLGSKHTVHLKDGQSARDGIWFEPGFMQADVFRPDRPAVFTSNSRWALRRIQRSSYRESLITALLRFVRGLDDAEANTAFLRLWAGLETLATPGQADYDRLVSRCSFLFKEAEFHRQILEHLREYRHANVHAGEDSVRARTHCFQLQLYFVNLVLFHIRNATAFDSLEEANAYLDLPASRNLLKRRVELTKRALKFIGKT